MQWIGVLIGFVILLVFGWADDCGHGVKNTMKSIWGYIRYRFFLFVGRRMLRSGRAHSIAVYRYPIQGLRWH
jgi:hypothetical protein